jgi:nitrogen fixation protein FixH
MSSSNASPRTRTLNGRHVLFAFVGFFAVVFVADGILIYKAVSTFGGLETDDAYRKGLAYNERITAAQEQAKRGWKDKLAYEGQTKRLRVSLNDAAGGAVSGLLLTAQLQRPATNRYDQKLIFEQTSPGTYEAATPELAGGWWTVELQAHKSAPSGDDAALYEARRRLWIKP